MSAREIFVFGSNTQGRHGKGAAKFAAQYYGAKYGQAEGLQGDSYAIVTKSLEFGKEVTLLDVKKGVDRFIEFAIKNKELKFVVTKIGCGLAGFRECDISNLFRNSPGNVNLPEGWERMEIVEEKEVVKEVNTAPLGSLGSGDEEGGKVVFFDLETGGLIADKHPIIQLAAIAVDSDTYEELDSLSLRLQFNEKDCDPRALEVNSYDKDVWATTAIPATDALQAFAKFLSKHATIKKWSKGKNKFYNVAALAGHNVVTFDVPFVDINFSRRRIFKPWSYMALDTLQHAIWWWKKYSKIQRVKGKSAVRPENFKLGSLCAAFDIPFETAEAHDAIYDVRATVKLAKAIEEFKY